MPKVFAREPFYRLLLLGLAVAAILLITLLGGGWGKSSTGAGTNIDSGALNHWAWNDHTGWIDFYTPDTVVVSNSKISGYASSSLGTISFDCATSPSGDICTTSTYAVANDGVGNLSGYAWSDVIGWISFCGGQSTLACPGTVTYQVVVNGSSGDWSGYAWNDAIGWISFNCINNSLNNGLCSPPNSYADYRVKTTWLSTSSVGWLESATYDTGVSGGAQINSIMWRGVAPAGTAVRFQMAYSSSSAGPWVYGWNSTASTSGAVAPDVPVQIDYTLGANQRYFRYRIYLYSDLAHTTSSRVDDVIVNWSR